MRAELQRGGLVVAAAAVLAGLLASHCGGGAPPLHIPPGSADGGGFSISGYAVKGPISGGTVTAYRLLADMSRGLALASANTDANGFFGLTLPAYNGDVLLVVTGGSYVEEALAGGGNGTGSTPLAVNVDFTGLVLGYSAGTSVTANVTPISHLAYHLALYHLRNRGEPLVQAVEDAFTHLGAHFGNLPGVAADLDWRTVKPAVLGSGGGAQLTAAERAAVILAGLSQLAATIATRADISPGGQVNALSLLATLAEDVEADGTFDGLGTAGRQLVLPANGSVSASGPTATALDGSTVRLALASAIADFVLSARNTSAITIPDIGEVTSALSADSDGYLFNSPGTTFDVVPPKLTLTSGPPPYTNQSTVTFTVAADDGPNSTGVKAVLARVGDGSQVTAVNASGNVWTFSNVPTGGTRAYFDVWAVDNANNSGEQLPVGAYHLRLPCLEDVTAPTITQDFSVSSYLDERSMLLAGNAVPAQFTWPTGTVRIAAGPGTEGAIWKSSVRLSWGPNPPDGAELEGPNENNVPFIQIGIPINATTDAPLTSVTYSISLQGGPTSTGSLLSAGRTAAGIVYYDLPLSQETIPSLASVSASPLAFTISITATDAAGNVTSQQLGSPTTTEALFTFHIIGPPLYLQQDASYPSSRDAKSIYPFALADATYASKFTGDNGGEIARQARFLVFNPHSVDVPFSGSFPSYRTTGTEEWDDSVWTVGSVTWDVANTCSTGPPCDYSAPLPQPYVTSPGSTAFLCEAFENPQSQVKSPSTAFTTASAQTSPWRPGAEDTRPDRYNDRVVVPAAQAGTPGAIVLYVGRAWSSFGLPPYVFSTYSNPDGVQRFYRFLKDIWVIGGSQGQGTCNCQPNPPGPPLCDHSMLYAYAQRRSTNVLSSASETFSGTWTYQSYARTGTTSDLGEGAQRSAGFSGIKSY
jgi:hypothetical protein